ncbi:hypothetical protein OFM35_31770, partial [Escherichia coli]|nr:hypothetical protein [Escherichia coli]
RAKGAEIGQDPGDKEARLGSQGYMRMLTEAQGYVWVWTVTPVHNLFLRGREVEITRCMGCS